MQTGEEAAWATLRTSTAEGAKPPTARGGHTAVLVEKNLIVQGGSQHKSAGVFEYFSLNPHVLNLRLPIAPELGEHLEHLLTAFLRIRHFPDTFSTELIQAFRSICEIIMQKSAPVDTLQVLAVCNQSEIVLGFKPSNNAFTAGHQGGDPRLRNVARRVDRIELFPLASRGELLKVIKRV